MVLFGATGVHGYSFRRKFSLIVLVCAVTSALFDSCAGEARLGANNKKRRYSMPQHDAQWWSNPLISSGEEFFSVYRTLPEINRFLEELVRLPTKLATAEIVEIGESHEKRPLRVVRLSGAPAEAPQSRGVLILGGVHGREWNALTAVLWAAHRIVRDYGEPGHEVLTEMLSNTVLHIVPMVNPDGFDYTWTNAFVPGGCADPKSCLKRWQLLQRKFRQGEHTKITGANRPPDTRLWRQNRRKGAPVDLNRNWGHRGTNWGHGDKAKSAMNYEGPEGFSEPETGAIDRYARRRGDISAFLDFHCCLGSIRAPLSFKPLPPDESRLVNGIGRALALTMRKPASSGYIFTRRRIQAGRGFQSGISSGWAFTEMGYRWAYTVEVGGSFCEEHSEIARRGAEALASIRMMGAHTSTTLERNRHQAIFGGERDEVFMPAWHAFLAKQGYWPEGEATNSPEHSVPLSTKATRDWKKQEKLVNKADPRRHKIDGTTGAIDYEVLAYAVERFGFDAPRRDFELPASAPAAVPLDAPELLMIAESVGVGGDGRAYDEVSATARPFLTR